MDNFLQYIYKWFKTHKRDLPWRETSDPYKIWLSEIILQQTRVEQGKKYYQKFIKTFPTVDQLAAANEDEVLKLWQGLGYYTRARNLYYTAKQISEKRGGKFPETYAEILNLKGVGPYTAAAIASIAYDLPHPAVDGNIYRVLARYFGIHTPIDSGKGKKEFFELAAELVPESGAGFHNQALMEFGALQCVPKPPNCNVCPVVETCFAAANKVVEKLPVKSKKVKQQTRYFYYFLLDDGETIRMEKRTGNDIWRNLFQLPMIETKFKESPEKIIKKTANKNFKGCNAAVKYISDEKKHILSHQVIHAWLIHIVVKNPECLNKKYLKVNKKDISNFAVPRLIELFLDKLKIEN